MAQNQRKLKQLDKEKRQKAKRNQFTMLEADDELIEHIQNRYLKIALPQTTKNVVLTRSQVIRAGIKLLNTLKNDDKFKKAIDCAEKLPEGRQKKT
jgi:hypothetical protein